MVEIALTGGAVLAGLVTAFVAVRRWPSDNVTAVVDRQAKVMDGMETLNTRLMATNDELEEHLEACRAERSKLKVKLLENENERILLEAELRKRRRHGP